MDFPIRNEYSDYFAKYVELLPASEVLNLLEKTQEFSERVIARVPQDLYDYKYGPSKWTVKELLMHTVDCEQIMAYRALRFARNDFQDTVSFDEDAYVNAMSARGLSWDYVVNATKIVRQQTLHMFKGFTEEESKRGGSAIFPNSVRAIAAIIAAHQLHHIYVLQERYLEVPMIHFEL